MSWVEEVKRIARGRVLEKEPMSRRTTFRVGGPCEAFFCPEGADDLAAVLKFLREEGVRHIVIGQGSNVLFPDDGYDGCVAGVGNGMSKVEFDPGKLEAEAEAGASLNKLALETAARGMAGLESLAGIPGSAGGAVFMNAGAFGAWISGPLTSVDFISADGERVRLGAAELDFGYRRSSFQDNPGCAIVSARFAFAPGDPASLKARAAEILELRSGKQPLDMGSAGSFFRNAEDGGPAGRLIDEAGLKGRRVGGAMVSQKHANFIVNAGGATRADILALADIVSSRVKELFGVVLVPEVRII